MLKEMPNVVPSISVKPAASAVDITMAIAADMNSGEVFLFSRTVFSVLI